MSLVPSRTDTEHPRNVICFSDCTPLADLPPEISNTDKDSRATTVPKRSRRPRYQVIFTTGSTTPPPCLSTQNIGSRQIFPPPVWTLPLLFLIVRVELSCHSGPNILNNMGISSVRSPHLPGHETACTGNGACLGPFGHGIGAFWKCVCTDVCINRC